MAIPLHTIEEYLSYIIKKDKWWIIPLLLFLVIIGLLMVLASTSHVPIFAYPMI